MLALLLLPLATGQTNDLCWGAASVTTGLLQVGNNYVASPFPQSPCIENLDVFYKYIPTCTGTATISVASLSATSLRIATYNDGRSCGGLGSCTWSSSGTEVSIDATVYGPTDMLYFAVGNSNTQSPPTTFHMNITCQSANVAAGDICARALPITTDVTLNFSTADARQDYQSPSRCQSPDIFLVYNATCDGDATATSITNGSSSLLSSFYAGSCDQIVSYDWARGCTSDSQTWPVRNGQIYYLAVGGSSDAAYSVSISCTPVPRPAHDECPGALSISTSSLVFDLTNTTRSVPVGFCGEDQDVWYSYVAACTGKLVAQFSSSVSAQAFKDCYYTPAAECSSGQTTFEFPVIMGQEYRLVFGENSDLSITANFTCEPISRPSNDQCAGALNVTPGTSQVVDITYATTDSYTACNSHLRSDAYLRYTTCAGNNTITIENNNATDITIAAFGDCNIEPLMCKDIGDSDLLTFDTPIAVPVYIAVGLYSAANTGGLVTVNFSCTEAPTSTPAPTAATTGAPSVATAAPTAAGNNSSAPTADENNTDTTAPTLSGATSLQLSFGLLFLVGATQMQ